MDLDTFTHHATVFAESISRLLDTCLPGETEFEHGYVESSSLRTSFKAEKPLYFSNEQTSRAQLTCRYGLCVNSTGEHLAVRTSSFALSFRALKKMVPIVRFEYERNARNKPVSHIQFHADSVPLGLMLARAGRYAEAAQQQDVHYPMGGHRYRVCVEDMVELVIREFSVQAREGWERAVSEGRSDYREKQASTIIRKNLSNAVAILEELGFEVTPPEGFQMPSALPNSEW